MKPHLEKAHQFWKDHLKPSDHVIDATCGNGKDTSVLAEIVTEGHVYAIDIQMDAIEKARGYVPWNNVTFFHRCHTHLPEDKRVKLVVYNLGYLPGGNKTLTSQTESTLLSVERALAILPLGGALSVTCYPGHPEGAKEEKSLQKWSQTLSQKVEWTTWKIGSPTLLTVIKVKTLIDS
jgi:SAM-dependent methyltransferase